MYAIWLALRVYSLIVLIRDMNMLRTWEPFICSVSYLCVVLNHVKQCGDFFSIVACKFVNASARPLPLLVDFSTALLEGESIGFFF